MKKILKHFIELFYPRLCVCCQNKLIDEEFHICLSCLHALPYTNHLTDKENNLEKRFIGRFPFSRIVSLIFFTKNGLLQKIVHEIKYKYNPELAIYMGEICGQHILKNKSFTDIDFIVPVPLHKNRLKKRGYNQSLLLAEGIARYIKRPICSDVLLRKKNNSSQTKNNRIKRWKNMEDVFIIYNPSMFENKHILLIDDIITTGSTIEFCVKQILKSENVRISIYTLGSTI